MTASPSRVLSPRDFGKPVLRRPQSSGRIAPISPKSARARPRTLPKVTSTLDSAPPVQEPLPVPSSVRVAAWCSTVGTSCSYDNPDFAHRRRAQCSRKLSSDTFGRRDSDSEDCPYPTRHYEDEDGAEMRQSLSASTYDSGDEKGAPSGKQRSSNGGFNASQSTPPTPQTAAWRKEADEEWEARFDRKFRSSSQHLSPRASLLNAASTVHEKGSSPKGSTGVSTSSAPLFKVHNPFSDKTVTREMKVTGSAGVPNSSSSYFPSHDHWRRSLPHNNDSGATHSESWNAWRDLGAGHRVSIGGSSRGHPEVSGSTVSRNNSMVSSTSSSSRVHLSHRTSSNNFLVSLIGRDLSSHSANSADASGTTSGSVLPKGDLKHLLRRSSKLSRPPSTEGLVQQGKNGATERCEGKGSPLKTAFPRPEESPRATTAPFMPAKAKRRMSMPSRQGQYRPAISNGMVTSFVGDHAPSTSTSYRRDRAPSVHRYASGPSSSSTTADVIPAAGTGDAKVHSQKAAPSSVSINRVPTNSDSTSSTHRPRSRSDAEVHRSDALTTTYPQYSASVYRRVFVPPAQMDPHDEEQHAGSEVSAGEESRETEQVVSKNVDVLTQERRERVEKPSSLGEAATPDVPTELIQNAPVMAPSRSISREKDDATLMCRTSSSRSSRTMASAGALLSPTKLLRRLASRDGLSSSSSNRGQGSSLDAMHLVSHSPSRQVRLPKPEDKTMGDRSPADSTSTGQSVETIRGKPLSRPKTAPAESEAPTRSRRPSLIWTGHSASVSPSDPAQLAGPDGRQLLEGVPTRSHSSIGREQSQTLETAPSSLGLYMTSSDRTSTLGDVPPLDSTSSSESASLDCSPYSAVSCGLPSPFSPSEEARIVQPALIAEAEANDEEGRSASPLYRPPTQSLYQRRRSSTLSAAGGVGITKPLSLFLDSTRKEAGESEVGMTGLYNTVPALRVDMDVRSSSGLRPVSPSPALALSPPSSLHSGSPGSSPNGQGVHTPAPPRPPRRNVAAVRPMSYFGVAGTTPNGQPALTPPSPANSGNILLGSAGAKAPHAWEGQGQLSGRGAHRSASPGKNTSTTRARIEKFFGGGMSTGKANAFKGATPP
ncbi:hypothetical protein BCV69DRAFT_300050 [Microstroma glucosiphilum]|uniref:Uncharacterized protein n=1 Tax=Pseudomicrostroma glucosiphilum TaxID=1684307 RepID=A0A316U353_9BASI|nr:hypothetical protein BCV69DRAFT_300050 [Pseudomicrostroma glucosiphilum]PWN19742.1 hypothetical protein BCV69DRAFT_300050 [Pseudomicrostroma glucosiphilum]